METASAAEVTAAETLPVDGDSTAAALSGSACAAPGAVQPAEAAEAEAEAEVPAGVAAKVPAEAEAAEAPAEAVEAEAPIEAAAAEDEPSAAPPENQDDDASASEGERVYSVYVAVPAGFEGVPLEMIFEEDVQVRIYETCRRNAANEATFEQLWPGGSRSFLDSMLQGLAESGRGAVAHGLERGEADALVAELADTVVAEVRVDREAAARFTTPQAENGLSASEEPAIALEPSEVPSNAEAGERTGADQVVPSELASSEAASSAGDEEEEAAAAPPADTAEADPANAAEGGAAASPGTDERVHSVYVTMNPDFEGIPLELIFDENVQARIYDIARRGMSPDIFRRLWPGGRRAMLESMLLGLAESGRGAVAHGLQQTQAETLAAQLNELVTAEVGVDREAAARMAETRTGDREGARPSPGADAGGDAAQRVHSLYCVLPGEMVTMLDFVLPEIMPRITGHRREFALSWPGGPAEMERALRQGIEEYGRGPLLHGLRLAQAEALEQQIRGLVEVEAVVDREAAKRVQERERRSRPPPRPPPPLLLSRFFPGARVRVLQGSDSRRPEIEKLQQGYGGMSEEHIACLGREGVIAAYSPAESSGQWIVRVSHTSESGEVCLDWNPGNLSVGTLSEPAELEADDSEGRSSPINIAGSWIMLDEEKGQEFHYEWYHSVDSDTFKGTQQGAGEVSDGRITGETIEWRVGEVACAGKIADDGYRVLEGRYWTLKGEQLGNFVGKKKDREVLLVRDEDLLAGDCVLFHIDGRWCAGTFDGPGDAEDSFGVKAPGGRIEANIPRQHIQLVVVLEPTTEPILSGAVVRILDDQEEAKRLQRGRWSDELIPCLGQLGVVTEVRDRRRLTIRCPAAGNPTTWNAACVKLDKSEGLRCLDLHPLPLWLCTRLETPRSCAAACGKTELRQAFCCLQASGSDGCALCDECAAPYLRRPSVTNVRCRHHLNPLTWVALPRGPQKSCWPCAGVLLPGGCRSAAQETGAVGGLCCFQSEYLLCDACHKDETLGEATAQTRNSDIADLPASVPRVAASIQAHPSEIFALAEAGLFAKLATCLGDTGALGLALDLSAWLAAGPPERPVAGPALVDNDGCFVEACVTAEEALSFDGSWTDETEPGRRVCTIKGGVLHPQKTVEAKADHYLEVASCGMSEFNGRYIAEGARGGKAKYRKATGGPQTCNYSDGCWYLAHDFRGSWYQCLGEGDQPPLTGWKVGDHGKAPPPTIVYIHTPTLGERFALLPSVGSWLQGRLDVEPTTPAHSEGQDLALSAPTDLDGIWRREGSNACEGDCMVISGTRLSWPDDTSTEIRLTGDGGASMDFQGQVYQGRARATPNGLRLQWSDGDVWIHCPPVASFADELPEEGQAVSYQGFTGCYIKEVISKDQVIIHVPGVGDRKAAAGQYTLRDSGVVVKVQQAVPTMRLGKDAFAVELEDGVHCAQLADGGRLVWVLPGQDYARAGANAWVRMENCCRCPSGHILRRSSAGEAWYCRSCGERWTNRRRLRCRSCDVNYCDNCFALQKWEKAPGAPSQQEGGNAMSDGADVEVCLPSSTTWTSCRLLGASDAEGAYRVKMQADPFSEQPTEQVQTAAAWRLRRGQLQAKPGPVDSLWLYESSTDRAMGIRYRPEIEGPHRGELEHGEVVRISEHRPGADGVMFLRLADERGWVFDTKPGVGTMCMLLRARAVDAGSRDGAHCSIILPGSEKAQEQVLVSQLRPPFSSGVTHSLEDPFQRAELLTARAELLTMLRRGPRCGKLEVRALLQRRVSLLQVEGGEDVLSTALKNGCSASVLEALLMSHAPIVAPEPVTTVVSEPAAGATEPEEAADAASTDGDARAPSLTTRKDTGAATVFDSLLALGEPRISALIADRGGALAALVAERLCSPLDKDAANAIAAAPSGVMAPMGIGLAAGMQAGARAAAAVDASLAGEGEALLTAPSARVDDAAAAVEDNPLGAQEALNASSIAAARRLAEARPSGSVADVLRLLGKELLVPMLSVERGRFEAIGPTSWLASLLRALVAAGYELTVQQVNFLAQAVITRLVEGTDEAAQETLNFTKLLLDVLSPGIEGIATLDLIRTAFTRHGIVARLERLLGGGDAGATVAHLSGERSKGLKMIVEGLVDQLSGSEPCGEDSLLVQGIVAALPSLNALEQMIQMLRDGDCTPYELWIHDVPAKIHSLFQAPDDIWPWATTTAPPVDAASMKVLVSSLQTLLGMWETFPVAALSIRGEGLDCLLQPHKLHLKGPDWKKELNVEPLLPLTDLERFVLQTVPIEDKSYLEWCEALCGRRIADSNWSPGGPWRIGFVSSFNMDSKQPVHTVTYEDNGEEMQLLLHLRKIVVLETGQWSSQSQASAKARSGWKTLSCKLLLYSAGSNVEARFKDGSWCRAQIERDNGDGTFNVRWMNGTKTDIVKRTSEMRPLPGKAVCQRVKVTLDNAALSGVAVWVHASGAQDVVDQEGRYLACLPADRVVLEAHHAQDSPGRPMPFEIRNLAMQGPGGPPQLERNFSAVDRHRPQLGAVPARRIGGPEGEPLRGTGSGSDETSPSQVALDHEVSRGSPAPRLRVEFFRVLLSDKRLKSDAHSESSPDRSPDNSPARESSNNELQSAEVQSGQARWEVPFSDNWQAVFEEQVAAAQKHGADLNALAVFDNRNRELGFVCSDRGKPELDSAPDPDAFPMVIRLQAESCELTCPLPSSSTVLQALLEPTSGRHVELSDRSCLQCRIKVCSNDDENHGPPAAVDNLRRLQRSISKPSNVGVTGISVPVFALLRRLRSMLSNTNNELEAHWENEPLNRKLEDQLAQPLLTAGTATPSWVKALPLAYPFLFKRRLREQLLHCTGFGTSHAVLWLQRRSIEEQYGDRLRRVEGQGETHMNLRENIVSDRRVFIGPARSDVVTLPSRKDVINDAARIMELTYTSKAVLEVKFADEGGFGDGVTQSFYTAVAMEFSTTSEARPRCGKLGLWAEHGEDGIMEHQGRAVLHARRGLFPRPYPADSAESRSVCRHFRFLGRLMAKALRDGFVVPLPLCAHFFSAVLGEDLPLAALPRPGDGYAGEFVGAAARFAGAIRQQHAALEGRAREEAFEQEAMKPGWCRHYLSLSEGAAMQDWSFNQYVEAGQTFCELGNSGRELCDGGSRRSVNVANLEEFVERAAQWWLRDGIAPQAAAFRQGVEDVCASSAIWSFEPDELVALFCGGQVEWTREDLEHHIRTKGDVDKRDVDLLVEALEKMTPELRGHFLEFVTACPRLPPGGLPALQPEITIVPSNLPGSLPRARTCVNELHLPKYESVEELEGKLAIAVGNAEGLYDDNRMGWMA